MSVHGRQVNFASRPCGRLSKLHTVTLVPLNPCRSVSSMSIGAKALGVCFCALSLVRPRRRRLRIGKHETMTASVTLRKVYREEFAKVPSLKLLMVLKISQAMMIRTILDIAPRPKFLAVLV